MASDRARDAAATKPTAATSAESFESRAAALVDAPLAKVADPVRRAVMLSMELTGKYRTVTGAEAYSHDDYDVAMAALNELVRRASRPHLVPHTDEAPVAPRGNDAIGI